MSEQTDTIADLLSNIRPCSCACPDHYRDVDREAAYLVEHGVRVVDGMTLARAVHDVIGSPFDSSVIEPKTSCRDIADALIAALDGEVAS